MPFSKASATKLNAGEWEAVQQLFHDALQLPESAQTQWLAAQPVPPRLRAEVESLLRSLDRNDQLSSENAAVEEPDPGDSHDDQLTGELCGPYRLDRFMAKGGMGWVYEGVRHSGDFRHRAAVKVIPSLFGPEMLETFRREKQILAEMNHPGIAHLLDGGLTERGLSYLAMEYVDGEPITAYTGRHVPDRKARIRLFLQVCDAVQYAHDLRVVHRDIKPENILVTSKGEAKLLDFGIAKLLEPNGLEGVTLVRAHTPSYASPEQLRGEPAGPASDIYQLGVLLADLLTDQTGGAGLRASGKALRKTLGPDLCSVVLRATEKIPESRYRSVAALAEDLRRYLSGQRVMATPRFSVQQLARRAVRHGGILGPGAGLAILLTAAGFVLHLKRQTREDEQRRRNALQAMFDDRPEFVGSSELDPSEMVWSQKRLEELSHSLEKAKRADSRNPDLPGMIGKAYGEAGKLAWARYAPSLGEVDRAEANLSRALTDFEAGAKTDPALRQQVLSTRFLLANLLIEKGQGWQAFEEIVKTILAERELNGQHWSQTNALDFASHFDMLSDLLGGRNWWTARRFPQRYEELIGVRAYLSSDRTALWLYRAALASGSLNMMEFSLAGMQMGRLEHENGMHEQGLRTLQKTLNSLESLRGSEPVAAHQRRIDSTHFAMCGALAAEENYLRAETECRAAIAGSELRAARHPQNRYLQEGLGHRELDTAFVLANSGHRGEARRRAEAGLKALEHDAAQPQTPSYALDLTAQRLLTVLPAELRNPALAATYASRAVILTAGQLPAYQMTLAIAQQASGKSEDAARTAREAIAGERRVLRTIAPLFESGNKSEVAQMFLQTNQRLDRVEKEFGSE